MSATRPPRATCWHYDNEGNLTSAQAPGDSQATTYTYDPAGLELTATNATGTDSYSYDEAGRLTDTTDTFGAEAAYSYDSDGNLISRSSATGPLATSTAYTTSYAYNDGDQLTTLTDPANRSYSFYYDNHNRLKATQYPNGTFSWNDYNNAGWLTDLDNRHGTLTAPLPATAPSDSLPLDDFTYSYNLEGQQTQQVESGGGLTTATTSYTYDNLGRLQTVDLPTGVSRSYSYDLDSNRTQISENGSTVSTYAYDPTTTAGVDELTSQTGPTRSFSYDSDGRMTARGGDTIGWDGWNRITGGTYSGSTLTYAYDPAGDLRSRTSAGATTDYLLGDLYETDGSGALQTSYVDGPAGNLASYNGPPTAASTATYLYYSGHGDLAAEADTSGNRTTHHIYDPFGGSLDTLPANTASHRYTGAFGKQEDSSSDLILMGARPYDPSLGRFLAVDPIDGGSLNNYDYAGQDPVDNFDLAGTQELGPEYGGDAQPEIPNGTGETGDAKRGARDSSRSDDPPKSSTVKYQEGDNPTVEFKAQDGVTHGSRGLAQVRGTTVPVNVAESAINSDINFEIKVDPFKGGPEAWTGYVNVEGQTIEYRAFRLSPWLVIVGTYFGAK